MQPKTFVDYLDLATQQAGSESTLGRIAGFTDGSRLGHVRRKGERLSPLACVKLARYTQDDPLWVLRLAGHEELADLLAGDVQPVAVEQTREALSHLQGIINLALQAIPAGGETNGEIDRHSKASRRVRG